jgi:SAM-dependent methyltransferase
VTFSDAQDADATHRAPTGATPPEALTDLYAVADVYDLKYRDYAPDVEFYVAAARETGGPVLEVGCGTGRVLLPALAAGVDIDGFDIRETMLDALRRKAHALGYEPRVFQADMRSFIAPRAYALVTIPFRAFLHCLTIDDQLATLRRVHAALRPGGALLLNVFHPSFDIIVNRPNGVSFVESESRDPETGRLLRVTSTPWYDRVNQILRGMGELQEIDADGRLDAVHPYAFTLRWIYKAEMELLLRVAGFARWQVWGDFAGKPLERDTDEMVWKAWKQ